MITEGSCRLVHHHQQLIAVIRGNGLIEAAGLGDLTLTADPSTHHLTITGSIGDHQLTISCQQSKIVITRDDDSITPLSESLTSGYREIEWGSYLLWMDSSSSTLFLESKSYDVNMSIFPDRIVLERDGLSSVWTTQEVRYLTKDDSFILPLLVTPSKSRMLFMKLFLLCMVITGLAIDLLPELAIFLLLLLVGLVLYQMISASLPSRPLRSPSSSPRPLRSPSLRTDRFVI